MAIASSQPDTWKREGTLEFDFTSSTLAKLSMQEQKAEYQRLAAQAEQSGFLPIARQWRALAEQLEAKGTHSPTPKKRRNR